MNNALIDGVNEGAGWLTYKPHMLGVLGTSGQVDADGPVFDPQYPQYQRARYLLSDGMVHGYLQIGMIGTFTPGASSYLFELPLPAKRVMDSLPVIIGEAMCYISFSNPSTDLQCVAQLADVNFKTIWDKTADGGGTSSVPNPDRYFQIQAPYAVRWGSDSVISTTVTNITHNLMAFDTSKMVPAEVTLTPTSAINGTGNFEPAYVLGGASLSPIQYGIKGQASAGASPGMTFDWKIEQHALTRRTADIVGTHETGTSTSVPTSVPMVGYRHPFDTSILTSISPFGFYFVSFMYEPA